MLLLTATSLSLIAPLYPLAISSIPFMWIALIDGFPSSVFIKLENFVVKEDHILELELKQVVKKLKEDPRIEMM